MKSLVSGYLDEMSDLLHRIDAEQVERIAAHLIGAFHAGAQLLVAGNGGSATTASHLACDFGKTVLGSDPQRSEERFRVVALGENAALLTAWANDVGYESVYAEEVKMLGRPGDVLLVLSVSGDSPNLVAAVRAARERELVTIGLLGQDGGAVRPLLDDFVLVQEADFGYVESAHLVLGHLLTRWLGEQMSLAR